MLKYRECKLTFGLTLQVTSYALHFWSNDITGPLQISYVHIASFPTKRGDNQGPESISKALLLHACRKGH